MPATRPKVAHWWNIASYASAGFVLAITHNGCARVDRSDLIGVWKAQYRVAEETLTLEDKGRYLQEIKVVDEARTAKTIANAGTWTYSPSFHGRVILKQCLSVVDGAGELNKNYEARIPSCELVVDREWLISPRVRIGLTEGSPFKKIR